MFFLRCVFWLSIVYASMSWTQGAFDQAIPRGDATPAARLGEKAVAGRTDLCARQPRQCLADAARLTALIDAGAESDPQAAKATLPADMIDPPMPVPDPRRRAANAMLTPAR